jgi:hypothetical protein
MLSADDLRLVPFALMGGIAGFALFRPASDCLRAPSSHAASQWLSRGIKTAARV